MEDAVRVILYVSGERATRRLVTRGFARYGGNIAVGHAAQDRRAIDPSTKTRGRYRGGHHHHHIHPTLHSEGADSVKV
jgi:hypothetical protein